MPLRPRSPSAMSRQELLDLFVPPSATSSFRYPRGETDSELLDATDRDVLEEINEIREGTIGGFVPLNRSVRSVRSTLADDLDDLVARPLATSRRLSSSLLATSPLPVASLAADTAYERSLAASRLDASVAAELAASRLDASLGVDAYDRLAVAQETLKHRVNAKIGALREENTDLVDEVVVLRSTVLDLERDNETLRARVRLLESRSTTAEDELAVKDKLQDKLIRELRQVEAERDESRNKAAEMTSECRKLKSRMTQETTQVDDLSAKNRRLAQDLEDASAKVSTLKRQKNTFDRQQDRLIDIIAELHAALCTAHTHAQQCRQRGYYTTRSKKVHDKLKEVFDALVEFAVAAAGSSKSRQAILTQLKHA